MNGVLDINFDSFSSKLYYQWTSLPACCYEKDLQFPQEIWAARVHTSSENQYTYFFFCSFQSENKKTAEIRAGSLSHLMTLPLDSTFVAMLCMLVLKCKPAGKLTVKKFENSNSEVKKMSSDSESNSFAILSRTSDEDIMEEDHALISSDVLTARFKCHFLRYNSSTLRSHKINNFYRRKLKFWNCVFQTLYNFHIMWKKMSLPRHYKHKCKFVHSGKNKIGLFSFCLECCCWCFFFLVNTR